MLYTELATVRVRTDPAFYGIMVSSGPPYEHYNSTYHAVHGDQNRMTVLQTRSQLDRSSKHNNHLQGNPEADW